MVSFQLTRKTRRRRSDLIELVESIEPHLAVGYDLAMSWKLGSEDLKDGWAEDSRILLCGDGRSIRETLVELSSCYPDPKHRLWFSALLELYTHNASLCPAVRAFLQFLRKEQERDWEAHLRGLPTRLNVGLILFFLPSTLYYCCCRCACTCCNNWSDD